MGFEILDRRREALLEWRQGLTARGIVITNGDWIVDAIVA